MVAAHAWSQTAQEIVKAFSQSVAVADPPCRDRCRDNISPSFCEATRANVSEAPAEVNYIVFVVELLQHAMAAMEKGSNGEVFSAEASSRHLPIKPHGIG